MGRRSRLESVSIPSLGGGRVDRHPSFSLFSLFFLDLSILFPYSMLTLVPRSLIFGIRAYVLTFLLIFFCLRDGWDRSLCGRPSCRQGLAKELR